jgi:hypothetical protein
MPAITVQRCDAPATLLVEWDNRQIGRQPVLTFVLPLFWTCWTACTLVGTWFAYARGASWMDVAMLAVAYVGVFALPLTWLLRYTLERVEMSPQEYRHYYVRYPWFSPIRWPVSAITSIEVGHYVGAAGEIDAVVTLCARSLGKRDIVAYWADDATKVEIFRAIDAYLTRIDSPIIRIDTTGGGS